MNGCVYLYHLLIIYLLLTAYYRIQQLLLRKSPLRAQYML